MLLMVGGGVVGRIEQAGAVLGGEGEELFDLVNPLVTVVSCFVAHKYSWIPTVVCFCCCTGSGCGASTRIRFPSLYL